MPEEIDRPLQALLESWDMIFLAPAGRNSPFSRDTGRSGRKTNPTQNAVRQLQRVSLSSANVSHCKAFGLLQARKQLAGQGKLPNQKSLPVVA